MTYLPASEVHFMSEEIYDHCPAVLNWERGNTGHKKQFRYFNMWSLLPEFKTKVQKVWKTELKGTKIYKLVGKMNITKYVLQRLNKERFSVIEGNAEIAMARLINCQEKIQKDPRNADLINEEVSLLQESIKWKVAKEQFFTQKRDSKKGRQYICCDLVRRGPIVQQEQIDRLEEQFTEIEVKEALWSISGDKSLGPDGYESQFFKDCWLKRVLPTVVAENQSAFVKGRSIVQNILICQDLVKLYNGKKTTRSCLIKIDLKKAYDFVEWGFVEEMLHTLNFPPRFDK
ncbi:uncharacterized protein LOC142180721 [Nicotiana tabacum]|uniref:Uncharacterized protein LOC142180721 n=1 Tax=Nicotiana tabacum TaxID=4097 RepID=A0AC58UHC1_TOBAC